MEGCKEPCPSRNPTGWLNRVVVVEVVKVEVFVVDVVEVVEVVDLVVEVVLSHVGVSTMMKSGHRKFTPVCRWPPRLSLTIHPRLG